ncbi:hypothetical protein D2T29_12405 [Sinirhodobacter populi]|uniref:Uncharacterized protein n=1 Tax=Paenirhodobacter populi TaxID=2306993 RepID=A0A443KCN6_9RHOB|nr:hypothetical protein [Sinirhodobacter populi]RWR30466.1 hypothetical protein D2T29_12405 [Sinirhodobacter populi]
MDLPEHEKLKAIKPLSQAIGIFIEWLGQNGMTICSENRSPYRPDEYVPIQRTTEKLLADHFEIDLNRLAAEKEAMLEEVRAVNATA